MKEELKAVALKYSEEYGAPFIAVKQKGEMAKRMVEIARENDVPLVEDKILSNLLFLPDTGEIVPENTWLALAKIFAAIMETEKKIAGN